MKELIDSILVYFCFIGLGAVGAAALVAATLPTALDKAKAAARANGKLWAALLAVPLLCAGRMVLHGSTKNNSQSNDAPMMLMLGSFAPESNTSETPATNALTRVEKWWRRGAWQDGHILRFDDDWRFPWGSNHLAMVEIRSDGKIYPSLKSDTVIAELTTPLALKPGESEVCCGRTTNDNYRIEWRRGHPNRDAELTADASIELFRNGDIITIESGVTNTIPYTIPFAHAGYGQDEDWVRANFTNADEIVSLGYSDWAEDRIGIDQTNGLYLFTASFTDAPPEPTRLFVGDYSVCVTNAGDYSFVLEKGTGYEFGTWPYNGDVDYRVQDDMGADAPILTSWWWDTPGEWTEDGGWNWLYLPGTNYFGYCCWMPTLQGAPNMSHLGPDTFPTEFHAVLTDYCGTTQPTFQWSASDENVQFSSPNAQTTTVTCDSLPSWDELVMSVQANFGGLSLESYLYSTYGTNDNPQVELSIDVPRGLALNGDIKEVTVHFTSDIETNGCVTLRCASGSNKIAFWSSPSNGVAAANSYSWNVQGISSFTCYIQGIALSDYEGVELKAAYTDSEGDHLITSSRTTVFACYTQPIANICYDGFKVKNPSFLIPNEESSFYVEVSPTTIPSSEIVWRVCAGTAIFANGNNGANVQVIGHDGFVDLGISVLGTTDSRMHIKTKVNE